MTLTAFLLVLCSAALHASWNFLSKRAVPSLAFYGLASATAALIWAASLPFLDLDPSAPPPLFWGLCAASAGFEYIYLTGLTHAYRRSDISFVYPMARAVPVLLTAVITLLAGFGKAPTVPALLGMVILTGGCLLMPHTDWRTLSFAPYRNTVMLFILLAAAGTTGYTIIDSETLKLLGRAWPQTGNVARAVFFLFLMETCLSVLLLATTAFSRAERAAFRRHFGKTGSPILSGVFSSSAYVLVLLAMGFVSNVSYLQAFRQISLPLGVLAGIFVLRERPGAPRMTGIVLVLAGLVLVALG